jgi:hypothetical protein
MDAVRMDSYMRECRELSLKARLGIALAIFDKFCSKNDLNHPLIKAFSDHFWNFLIVGDTSEFSIWDGSPPFLFKLSQHGLPTNSLSEALANSNVELGKFLYMVSAVADTFYNSLYGAAENEPSFQALSSLINSAGLNSLPPITPFKFSRFSEGYGWGDKLTAEDVAYWRCCFSSK